jgi:hypothetical protein
MQLCLAALVLIVGAVSAEAQWLDRKTAGVPRTPDGVHADGRTLESVCEETVFEGLGLGYQFIVDGTGRATDLVVIHISGPYKYSRVK